MMPETEGSFWQKDSVLQQTVTLLQGPKDPGLPSLIKFIYSEKATKFYEISTLLLSGTT